MSGVEKIAVLFRVLGTRFARPMSEMLRPEEISRIGEAMVRFEEDPPTESQVKEVLDEFEEMLSHGGLFANVMETLSDLFIAKFGPEQGPQLLEEVRVNAQVDSPFDGLKGVPHSDLARVLAQEHVQVQAAVLANIDPDTAAGVLFCFDEDTRMDLVGRIATMNQPPPRMLHDIADLFIEKTRKLPRFRATGPSAEELGIQRAAEILNATRPEPKKKIMETLEEKDPDLLEKIKDTMFTFDDLARIDKKSMQQILGGIDTKVLAIALKAATPEVTEAIFQAVSQRTREMILEEKDLLGPMPLGEVQAAQKEIMVTIRELIDSGAVTVQGGGADAQLVE